MNDTRDTVPEVMKAVEKCLEQQEYREALDLCGKIMTAGTIPRKFWFNKARALEGLGDKALAVEAYRCEIASVARVPPMLLQHIGILLVSIGELARGVVCLQEACRLDPTPEAFIYIAVAFSRQGRQSEAIQAARKAIELDPGNDEAWHNLGVYLLDNSPGEAVNAFLRSLNCDPSNAKTYGALALAYLAQDRMEEAVQAAQRGLKMDPISAICHFALGQARELEGQLAAAEESFAASYRAGEYDIAESLLSLARVLDEQGKTAKAHEEYARALRAWPDSERVYCEYVRFAQSHDEYAGELTDLSERWKKMKCELKPDKRGRPSRDPAG